MRLFPTLTLLGAAHFGLLRAHKAPTATTLGPSCTADGPCIPTSTAQSLIPTQDTAYDFLTSPTLSSLANHAPIPANYKPTFIDLHASCSGGDNYLGYATLDTYDTEQCASMCDKQKECRAFNIFVERAPVMDVGPWWPDPPSIAVVKCSFWSAGVWESQARNSGYRDYDFVVAIAASNGYVKPGSEGTEGGKGFESSFDTGMSGVSQRIPLLGYALCIALLITEAISTS